MSHKQAILEAVAGLPETATWSEITDALLALVARQGSAADFARQYRTQLTADQLAEYQNPSGDIPLESVLAELEARGPARESA